MANVSRYDPVGELFDDLFKGFFVKPVGYESAPTAPSVRGIRIDVSEQDGEYKVHAELPGVKKDDIRVHIEGDQVSIAAEVKSERDLKEGERVVHSERYRGKVARTFRLGEEIDDSKAEAKYADGVLQLRLPKKAVAASRQISIQ